MLRNFEILTFFRLFSGPIFLPLRDPITYPVFFRIFKFSTPRGEGSSSNPPLLLLTKDARKRADFNVDWRNFKPNLQNNEDKLQNNEYEFSHREKRRIDLKENDLIWQQQNSKITKNGIIYIVKNVEWAYKQKRYFVICCFVVVRFEIRSFVISLLCIYSVKFSILQRANM